MFEIREDDLSGDATRALIALHLTGMHSNTPPEHVFALNLADYRIPEIVLWSAWKQQRLAGIGALKQLGGEAGEVKSMRTHPDFLRQGVASVLLEHIIAKAQDRGIRRLSLETGRGQAFEPALRLYRKRGFREGEAFGDYAASDFSQFLHLDL
jgi:putative acetyltransferase